MESPVDTTLTKDIKMWPYLFGGKYSDIGTPELIDIATQFFDLWFIPDYIDNSGLSIMKHVI